MPLNLGCALVAGGCCAGSRVRYFWADALLSPSGRGTPSNNTALQGRVGLGLKRDTGNLHSVLAIEAVGACHKRWQRSVRGRSRSSRTPSAPSCWTMCFGQSCCPQVGAPRFDRPREQLSFTWCSKLHHRDPCRLPTHPPACGPLGCGAPAHIGLTSSHRQCPVERLSKPPTWPNLPWLRQRWST